MVFWPALHWWLYQPLDISAQVASEKRPGLYSKARATAHCENMKRLKEKPFTVSIQQTHQKQNRTRT